MTKTDAANVQTSNLQLPPLKLPNQPLTVMEPSKSLATLNLHEIWAYRELLYFLTWRDVKIRYKQTTLGAAWAILQPIFMMLIFSVFFGRLTTLNNSLGIPYPLFVFVGLVPWTFFANSVTNSGNSLVNSAGLITKVYFPRMIVPMASVAASFIDFLLAFIILIGMMVYYHIPMGLNLFMLPAVVALTCLFALAIGTWLAALNVKYRDIRFALPFLIQIWLFVSSVIVPSTVLPDRWHWVLILNPMSGIIEGYRSALFGLPFDWSAIAISAALTFGMLVFSAYSFRKVEKNFADII